MDVYLGSNLPLNQPVKAALKVLMLDLELDYKKYSNPENFLQWKEPNGESVYILTDKYEILRSYAVGREINYLQAFLRNAN